ncbi:MAG: UDP-N-acetylmuramoyl-tripeptide--D-alanyl-D-alanine ligase, partial [Clostridia bacterium]|nr:UDP-N-acetylmuramoyl-tripeptide--D-alanyl-D-alanine ligase [Clostridia bacterium]
MILSDLCSAAGLSYPPSAANVPVSGICTDAGRLAKGELFVCLRGTRGDGHDHLPRAMARGACAALIDR